MSLRINLIAYAIVALCSSPALAQPRPVGLPPAPLAPPAPQYLPPPLSNPQGLGSGINPIAPRPLGTFVAPSGGLGYGPLGDRTGYPGVIYNTYRGSYLTPPTIPPLVLETPPNIAGRPGQKLPTLDVLFPGVPPMQDPEPIPLPLRMPKPVPPGPVVPVGAK